MSFAGRWCFRHCGEMPVQSTGGPSPVHLLLFVAFFFKSLLQSCFIVRGGYFPLFFPPLNTSALYLRVASSCALLCGKSLMR